MTQEANNADGHAIPGRADRGAASLGAAEGRTRDEDRPPIVPDQGGVLAELKQLIDDYTDRDVMAGKYPFPIGFVPISLLSPLVKQLYVELVHIIETVIYPCGCSTTGAPPMPRRCFDPDHVSSFSIPTARELNKIADDIASVAGHSEILLDAAIELRKLAKQNESQNCAEHPNSQHEWVCLDCLNSPTSAVVLPTKAEVEAEGFEAVPVDDSDVATPDEIKKCETSSRQNGTE